MVLEIVANDDRVAHTRPHGDAPPGQHDVSRDGMSVAGDVVLWFRCQAVRRESRTAAMPRSSISAARTPANGLAPVLASVLF